MGEYWEQVEFDKIQRLLDDMARRQADISATLKRLHPPQIDDENSFDKANTYLECLQLEVRISRLKSLIEDLQRGLYVERVDNEGAL